MGAGTLCKPCLWDRRWNSHTEQVARVPRLLHEALAAQKRGGQGGREGGRTTNKRK